MNQQDLDSLHNILGVDKDDVFTWPTTGPATEDQKLARKTLLKVVKDNPEDHNQSFTLGLKVFENCDYSGCLVGWAGVIGGNNTGSVMFASHLLGVELDQMCEIYGEFSNRVAVKWLENLVEEAAA